MINQLIDYCLSLHFHTNQYSWTSAQEYCFCWEREEESFLSTGTTNFQFGFFLFRMILSYLKPNIITHEPNILGINQTQLISRFPWHNYSHNITEQISMSTWNLGCVVEFFKSEVNSTKPGNQEDRRKIMQGYKSALNTKATEDSMVGC